MVELWLVNIELGRRTLRRFLGALDTSEAAKADRYRREADRERYAIVRTALRRVLARHLGVGPPEVQFVYGPYGKPGVVGVQHLQFNVSHADEWGLIGVAYNRKLGVDIERVRSGVEYSRIADQFFSRSEAAILRRLPEQEGAGFFFRLWARKEALSKAVGTGLSSYRMSVDVAPGDHFGQTWSIPEPGWMVQDLDRPGTGYAAAIAVEGEFRSDVVYRSIEELD